MQCSQDLSVLLLVVAINWTVTTAQECTNGEVRDSLVYLNDTDDYGGNVEYCRNGTWSKVCFNQWTINSAIIVCRQLGYSDQGSRGGATPDNYCVQAKSYVSITCDGTEESLDECTVDNCTCNRMILEARAACKGECANEEIRLVGGSTNREGRVEVCMDGRWGAVCNNSQEGIAGAVCSQLGFSKVIASVSLDITARPIMTKCTFDGEDMNVTCVRTNSTHCDRSTALVVTCLTHKEATDFLISALNETNQALGKRIEMIQAQSGVFSALFSVTVVILIAVTSGWIATCVVVKCYLVYGGRKRHENHHRRDDKDSVSIDERNCLDAQSSRDFQIVNETSGHNVVITAANQMYELTGSMTRRQDDESVRDAYAVVDLEQKRKNRENKQKAREIPIKPQKYSGKFVADKTKGDPEFFTQDDIQAYAVVDNSLM